MKVLVACEESQRVCTAFRQYGHEAYSCDLIPCSGFHPEWHIQDDALKVLYAEKWDLVIAHPPCTYLTRAGACNIPTHPDWISKGFEAKKFFMEFFDYARKFDVHMAIENPIPMACYHLPPYSQLVRPWQFGDPNDKPICLWLYRLPFLTNTCIVKHNDGMRYWINKKTGKLMSGSVWYYSDMAHHSCHRSKTFPGVAAAMADQWGSPIIFNYI